MNLEDTILISAFVDSQDGAFGKPWNEQQIELFAPYKKRIKMIILKDFTDKPEAAHRRITSQLRMFMDDISNTMIFGGNVSKRLLQIQLGSWGSLEDYVNCEGPARKVS
uniref:Uncharacterized protein n=1 Tax=Acrobeloides nanus TaxID=290746 RepID=A0A914DSB5_9BILA